MAAINTDLEEQPGPEVVSTKRTAKWKFLLGVVFVLAVAGLGYYLLLAPKLYDTSQQQDDLRNGESSIRIGDIEFCNMESIAFGGSVPIYNNLGQEIDTYDAENDFIFSGKVCDSDADVILVADGGGLHGTITQVGGSVEIRAVDSQTSLVETLSNTFDSIPEMVAYDANFNESRRNLQDMATYPDHIQNIAGSMSSGPGQFDVNIHLEIDDSFKWTYGNTELTAARHAVQSIAQVNARTYWAAGFNLKVVSIRFSNTAYSLADDFNVALKKLPAFNQPGRDVNLVYGFMANQPGHVTGILGVFQWGTHYGVVGFRKSELANLVFLARAFATSFGVSVIEVNDCPSSPGSAINFMHDAVWQQSCGSTVDLSLTPEQIQEIFRNANERSGPQVNMEQSCATFEHPPQVGVRFTLKDNDNPTSMQEPFVFDGSRIEHADHYGLCMATKADCSGLEAKPCVNLYAETSAQRKCTSGWITSAEECRTAGDMLYPHVEYRPTLTTISSDQMPSGCLRFFSETSTDTILLTFNEANLNTIVNPQFSELCRISPAGQYVVSGMNEACPSGSSLINDQTECFNAYSMLKSSQGWASCTTDCEMSGPWAHVAQCSVHLSYDASGVGGNHKVHFKTDFVDGSSPGERWARICKRTGSSGSQQTTNNPHQKFSFSNGKMHSEACTITGNVDWCVEDALIADSPGSSSTCQSSFAETQCGFTRTGSTVGTCGRPQFFEFVAEENFVTLDTIGSSSLHTVFLDSETENLANSINNRGSYFLRNDWNEDGNGNEVDSLHSIPVVVGQKYRIHVAVHPTAAEGDFRLSLSCHEGPTRYKKVRDGTCFHPDGYPSTLHWYKNFILLDKTESNGSGELGYFSQKACEYMCDLYDGSLGECIGVDTSSWISYPDAQDNGFNRYCTLILLEYPGGNVDETFKAYHMMRMYTNWAGENPDHKCFWREWTPVNNNIPDPSRRAPDRPNDCLEVTNLPQRAKFLGHTSESPNYIEAIDVIWNGNDIYRPQMAGVENFGCYRNWCPKKVWYTPRNHWADEHAIIWDPWAKGYVLFKGDKGHGVFSSPGKDNLLPMDKFEFRPRWAFGGPIELSTSGTTLRIVPCNTVSPSNSPTSAEPTDQPTDQPTDMPLLSPSNSLPSVEPTEQPTDQPTNMPSLSPTNSAPSAAPSDQPTNMPSVAPTTQFSSRGDMLSNGWTFINPSETDYIIQRSGNWLCGSVPQTSYCGYSWPQHLQLEYISQVSGWATLSYGHSWVSGSVEVFLNGHQIDALTSSGSKTVAFHIRAGDKLMLQETDAVLNVHSLSFDEVNLPSAPSVLLGGTVSIDGCTASRNLNNFPCQEAFDGEKTSKRNGWAVKGWANAWSAFQLGSPSTVVGLTLLSGIGRSKRRLKDFKIELKSNGVYQDASDIQVMVDAGTATVNGARVTLTRGASKVQLLFNQVSSCTHVKITVFSTDAPKNNLILTEIMVHSDMWESPPLRPSTAPTDQPTNMPSRTLSWEQGNCRGSAVWAHGWQWDCVHNILGQQTLVQCEQECLQTVNCASFDSSVHPDADNGATGTCCLFQAGASGNGFDNRWCYTPF